MNTRAPFLLGLALVAAMVALSAWALPQLHGRTLPILWSASGIPAQNALSAGYCLFLLPALTALLNMFFGALPSTSKMTELSGSRSTYVVCWLGSLLLLGGLHAVMVANQLGASIPLARAASLGIGLLLVAVGNVLPRARYNRVLGIRNPWTLSEEYVWDKTHRFGGFCFVLSGASISLASLTLLDEPRLALGVAASCLCAAAFCTAYSAVIAAKRR
jgi:uncharacterized membrane protein